VIVNAPGELNEFQIMDWTEVTGLVASVLSSLTFMPQVYLVWKTKSVKDLSLAMMVIVFFSTVLWLIYGFSISSLPVVFCNGVICILSLILIYFKFSFARR